MEDDRGRDHWPKRRQQKPSTKNRQKDWERAQPTSRPCGVHLGTPRKQRVNATEQQTNKQKPCTAVVVNLPNLGLQGSLFSENVQGEEETMEPWPSLGSVWCPWEGGVVLLPSSVKRNGIYFWNGLPGHLSSMHAEGGRFESGVVDGNKGIESHGQWLGLAGLSQKAC